MTTAINRAGYSHVKTMPCLLGAVTLLSLMVARTDALVPYVRPLLWDAMFPTDDPFRTLEQTPLTLTRDADTLALALERADWKETASAYIISLDVPGMKKEDIKIEVEENRVLRVSGERRSEKESEGDEWHRAERTTGKFWRQFRLPGNADLDRIKAHLKDGVLKIDVPKFAEQPKRQPKLIDIAHPAAPARDIGPSKSAT